jgi:hypothetical protein
MRTSPLAVAVENKAVTATTKHIAMFVKRIRIAPMIVLPWIRLVGCLLPSHQHLTAFGWAVLKIPLPKSSLHALFPLKVANRLAVRVDNLVKLS